MTDDNGAPEASGRIRTGALSGTMVVGNGNTVYSLSITAEDGSTVTVQQEPLPAPVMRRPISQLPRSTAEPLIGRARDVTVLQEAVETRQLVQIWGAAGVGKSALLRHLACELPRGPEGVAHIEAGGRTADDLAQAIFDISFDAPNYKPSPEVLKEHLKTLRLRIYLDDAALDENDLRRLFDMASQSTFVFTSQARSAVDGVHAIRLEGLTAPAAAELVTALLARELRPDEATTVAALCDAVDGNPLRLRRIALSAATGKGLPGIDDLPELLPALLNKLGPQERDLLHLLGSLSGAELAARHLHDLLGGPDIDSIAEGLVRHGLLLSSETGYSCPPDVAEAVLNSRRTEFPADQLCRAFTVWVEAGDTTPDDVAAHFQALDVAVLRAERSGHAQLGVELARVASPKLALSRQFDAWGSLLGVGWVAAKSAGDEESEEFFQHEARTRLKAIGRVAQATALVLEAEVLWHELTTLHGQSVAHQVAGQSVTHQAAGRGGDHRRPAGRRGAGPHGRAGCFGARCGPRAGCRPLDRYVGYVRHAGRVRHAGSGARGEAGGRLLKRLRAAACRRQRGRHTPGRADSSADRPLDGARGHHDVGGEYRPRGKRRRRCGGYQGRSIGTGPRLRARPRGRGGRGCHGPGERSVELVYGRRIELRRYTEPERLHPARLRPLAQRRSRVREWDPRTDAGDAAVRHRCGHRVRCGRLVQQ